MPILDFAYDKHDEWVRRLGRFWVNYFDEGTQLANMADVPGEAELRGLAKQAISDPSRNGLFD